jgi:hypothetical protein
MSEIDDYRRTEDDLDLGDHPVGGPRHEPGGPGGGRRLWPWLIVLAVIAAAAAGWWLFRDRAEEPAPPPVEALPAEVPGPATEEPVEDPTLPALDASDRFVAEAIRRLSSRPELTRYLATEGLLRRFVAAVDNVSQGVSPRPNLPELIPGGGYRVSVHGGAILPDPASYRRYDALTEVFVSIDTEGAARLYRRLHPLLEEAYRELGYPEGDFDATLERAIDHLLATPVPPPAPELVPAGVGGHAYADPRLEGLSAAQKHLLRTGPRNQRRLQAKLEDLAGALGL